MLLGWDTAPPVPAQCREEGDPCSRPPSWGHPGHISVKELVPARGVSFASFSESPHHAMTHRGCVLEAGH